MTPRTQSEFDFNEQRIREGWKRMDQLLDPAQFKRFVDDEANASHKRFGPYAMAQVKGFREEVEGKCAAVPAFVIHLDEGPQSNFVSLFSRAGNADGLIWSCWRTESDRRDHEVEPTGAACLRAVAKLATGSRPDARLRLLEQEDRSFIWKAVSVHPLQVRENAYQRVVHQAGREGDDPLTAETETLERFFFQDAGSPECFGSERLDAYDGDHLASVRMNHLIGTFYLFRLLVGYRAESGAEISEELRMALSGDLTKLLHNGDRARMGWLSEWLTEKIAELGKEITALNKPGETKAIFFLKGGRALNYFLGTPEKGENDWDTQVVIDPRLPAEEWYSCLARVHDALLVALMRFKTEFTLLVEKNAAQFAAYLQDKAGPDAADDEEVDENEESDGRSLGEHASCEAELIDIGIPRRDSASALEEWNRLSSPGALLTSAGVVYPHREYYLNEYLMMVRQAFLPNADVRKAPKRITRFGRVLESEAEPPGPRQKKLLEAFPHSMKIVVDLSERRRRQLFGVVLAQFAEAYNLLQDEQLAAELDRECLALITSPPPLPRALAELLCDEDKALAADVGVAHEISQRMDRHWAQRNQFFESRLGFFSDLVGEMSLRTKGRLQAVGAQFAIAGSFAVLLHARHLRIKQEGLEPIRRVLVKLQCPHGSDRAGVLGAVRDAVSEAVTATHELVMTEGEKEAILVYSSDRVKIGDFSYAPLVMKIRVAEQSGNQLPVLASIDGLPVLDLRYLAADYLRKTSKIDEAGSRSVLASATASISEMLSHFDFDSDDSVE